MVASMTLSGCSRESGTPSFKSSGEAVARCKAFLSDIRKMDDATIEQLASSVYEWRTLGDSTVACLERDTTERPYGYHRMAYRQTRDSVSVELCRLAQSRRRSYRDLFYLKENTSSFANDPKLAASVNAAKPFFVSLDTITAYIKGGKNAVLERYRAFLKSFMARGIQDKTGLLSFIKDEHTHFLSFLHFLPEFADCEMADIMRDTENCCTDILKSSGNKGLSRNDAVLYLTMRINKRLIANAKAALTNISNGRVGNEECACAYVWMLIQPFMVMDDFAIATLSDVEKADLYKIADDLPKAVKSVDSILDDGKQRLPEMPLLLMKVYLTRL